MLAVGQVLVGGVDVGPAGGMKGLRAVGLAGLDQAAHAHRLAVGLLRLDVLVELGARLAAHAELGAGQRRQDAVAGAVGEEVGLDGVPRLRRRLPALTRRMRSPSISASLQEQFSSSAMFGSKRTFS